MILKKGTAKLLSVIIIMYVLYSYILVIAWQKANQHPPKPNATSKYFSWDIPRNATTTVRKLPNCNTETPNKRRKLPERPSQYYTSLEVSVSGELGILH